MAKSDQTTKRYRLGVQTLRGARMASDPATTKTASPEAAFAVIDASGRIDPMSVRRDPGICFVYAGALHLEEQGAFQVVPVKIVVDGEPVQIEVRRPDRSSRSAPKPRDHIGHADHRERRRPG